MLIEHMSTVAGQQYADVCALLLTAYDPRPPALGQSRIVAAHATDEEIRRLVRRLCGVAASNRKYPPATATAAMAVAMCK